MTIKRFLITFIIFSLLSVSNPFGLSVKADNPVTEADVINSVEAAHTELWSRFFDENYILYDYVGLDGEVYLPTAEECDLEKPNALAWWTPIENGPFFTGLYIDALINKWKLDNDLETSQKIKNIANGLVTLSQVSNEVTGFIPRGLGEDNSFYALSSDDQIHPWFYALWRYVKSGIPTLEESQYVVAAMTTVADAMQAVNWLGLPGKENWTFRGNFEHFSARTVSRYLFMLRAMYDVTNDQVWLTRYNSKLNSVPNNTTKTRLEIIKTESLYESINKWTKIGAQASLRALFEMEEDPVIRYAYYTQMMDMAEKCAADVSNYANFNNSNNSVMTLDWRPLNNYWEPHSTSAEAEAIAYVQVSHWNTMSPRRQHEANYLREPLMAAWGVVLSGNETLINQSKQTIYNALAHYEWEKLYYSTFFTAECVYYQIKYDEENPLQEPTEPPDEQEEPETPSPSFNNLIFFDDFESYQESDTIPFIGTSPDYNKWYKRNEANEWGYVNLDGNMVLKAKDEGTQRGVKHLMAGDPALTDYRIQTKVLLDSWEDGTAPAVGLSVRLDGAFATIEPNRRNSYVMYVKSDNYAYIAYIYNGAFTKIQRSKLIPEASRIQVESFNDIGYEIRGNDAIIYINGWSQVFPNYFADAVDPRTSGRFALYANNQAAYFDDVCVYNTERVITFTGEKTYSGTGNTFEDFSVYKTISDLEGKNKLYAHTYINAVQEETLTATMIMARYKGDGTLEDISIGNSVTIAPEDVRKPISMSMSLPPEGVAGQKIKVFLWDGVSNIIPLSNAGVLK